MSTPTGPTSPATDPATDLATDPAAGGAMDPAVEIEAVAGELERHARSLQGSEAQDSARRYAVALRELVGMAPHDPPAVAASLGGCAFVVERLGAEFGGYELLRPMLALGARLRAAQDVVDPDGQRSPCPRCGQLMRGRADPVTGSPGPESHSVAGGFVCA